MGIVRNPYLNRSMIRSVDAFYGRRREVERIMARIGAHPPQSVSIVGERRVGKSSLLWHVAQPDVHSRYLDNPEQFVFLMLDFQGQQHLDLEGFCRVFGRHLQEAIGERLEIEGAEFTDLGGVEDALHRLEGAGFRLVCLFDEFEAVVRNITFGPEFFGFLRSVANAHPVAFVTSSRQQLERLCHTKEISESPFFNIFSQVRVGPLLDLEARDLISIPSEKVDVALDDLTEEILRLSGRLPFFLQIACSAAFECLQEAEGVELDPALLSQRFHEESDSHFQYLWERFEEEQQQIVAALARQSNPPLASAATVKSLVADGYLEPSPDGHRLFSSAFADFLEETVKGEDHSPVAAAEPSTSPQPRVVSRIQVDPVPEGPSPFPEIIGSSESLRRVFALMQKAIQSDVTVLLTGETGTGKELVARTIHEHSARSAGSFVAVNCGAIAEQLQESELFGHKKGAFTGAVSDREGLFEAASGGTLFLDEIGKTSPSTQVRLLRVLQEGEIRRVGDSASRSVDVRLTVATNRELEAEVEQGRFREDLFYRLYVLVLDLPPLRQRRSDITKLAEHFLKGHHAGVSDAAMKMLRSFQWSGNIRELENQLAAARAMAGDARIEPNHLWSRLQEHPVGTEAVETETDEEVTWKQAREQFERQLLQARLRRYPGDMNGAAKSLGLSRSRLYELARRYGIKEQ